MLQGKSLLEASGKRQAAVCAYTHRRCVCRYVSALSNHVVNPVITPSAASGTPSGIMAAALVGPDYKYTAVWTPINMQLGESPKL